MSIIIDLNLVCMICLQDGELRSIFEKDEDTDMKISEKILKCSELEIHIDSKLPDKICWKCIQDLAATYRFQQNCAAALEVFRTIKLQEDAVATYELEQQKIKIPSGLKIKRIQPASRTYLMPIEMEEEEETAQTGGPAYSEKEEVAFETVDEAKQDPDRDNDKVMEKDGEKSERDEEEEEVEEVDIDDYYETEEILAENSDEEIVQIKLEKLYNANKCVDKEMMPSTEASTNDELIPETPKKEFYIKSEHDEKHDDDASQFTSEEITPTIEEQCLFPKRRRGRPKKTINDESSEKQTANANGKTSNVLKTIPSARKTRKRNTSVSPDATKPTKICEICGNSYKYQHALKAHMRRHNNDRPYNCEFCDKAFVSAVELRRHMRVHTGQKPYACKYCDRRFSDFGSRIKHERTHTGERPYSCLTCGKAFAYAHVLNVHLRTHTGEKKFKCIVCGRGFTKKLYLQTHFEQHARTNNVLSAATSVTNTEHYGASDVVMPLRKMPLEKCMKFSSGDGDDDGHDVDDEVDDDDDMASVTTVSVIHMDEEHLDINEDYDDNTEEITSDIKYTYIKQLDSDNDDDDIKYEADA